MTDTKERDSESQPERVRDPEIQKELEQIDAFEYLGPFLESVRKMNLPKGVMAIKQSMVPGLPSPPGCRWPPEDYQYPVDPNYVFDDEKQK
jgi:hypothetical protein